MPSNEFQIAFFISIVLCTNLLPAQGHYPLQTDNLWQYSDYYDSSYAFTTRALGDTSMPNGLTYLHVRSDHELYDQYFRQSGTKVYSYSTSNQIEELWYDFSKTTFDTVAIHYYPTDTSTVVVAYDRMQNVFGKPRRQWGFYESFRHTSFYVLSEVTDSIGLTYYEYEPGIIVDGLRGAIINGTTYGIITSVVPTNFLHPTQYELFQNYPNPFNPATTISFSLPHRSHVSLIVYNLLGMRVQTLIEGDEHPGSHNVVFDGAGLASGVYYARLHAGDYTEAKKLLLIR